MSYKRTESHFVVDSLGRKAFSVWNSFRRALMQKPFLALLSLAVASCLSAAEPPNIVWIFVEDMTTV